MQGRKGYQILAAVVGFCLIISAGCAPQMAHENLSEPAEPPAQLMKFSEFFKMPIGPYGLEPGERLLSLQGQRVRIRGFVVHDDEPTPGFFMMSPVPVGLGERADGPADDLPASTLFVQLPDSAKDRVMAQVRGPVEVTGILNVGGRPQPDGRMSYVRLKLEREDAVQVLAPPPTVAALPDASAVPVITTGPSSQAVVNSFPRPSAHD